MSGNVVSDILEAIIVKIEEKSKDKPEESSSYKLESLQKKIEEQNAVISENTKQIEILQNELKKSNCILSNMIKQNEEFMREHFAYKAVWNELGSSLEYLKYYDCDIAEEHRQYKKIWNELGVSLECLRYMFKED